MNFYKLICIVILCLFASNIVFAQGSTCETATPMCDDITPYPINYTGTGLGQGPQAPAGPNYGCLATTGNPTFFTITITQSGSIQFDLQNTNVIDVDFILWGPFTDLFAANAACGNLGNGGTGGGIIDCSYDPQAFETVDIASAVAGQVYILMVTNYENTATDVFSTPNVGTGALGCPCQLDVDYTLPPLANNNGLMTAVNGDSAEFTVCPGDTLYFNMAIGADNLADTLTIFNSLTTIAGAFSASQYEIFGPFYPNSPLQDSMEILIMITPGPNDFGVFNFSMGVQNSGTSDCFDSYPVSVVVPGIPELPLGDTICSGGTYQMTAGSFPVTASGSNTYLWTQISGPVAAFDNNTLQNPTITPPVIPSGDSMSFQLEYTYGNCTQFDTVTVYGYDISINMTAAPNPVCSGQPVNLTAVLSDSVGAETTYTCIPSYTDNVVVASPTLVPGSGTSVSLGDDQLSGALNIGFPFTFYCNNYTQFYISSNGFVTFDPLAGNGCCQGQFLPDGGQPNNVIALNWTDLDPSSGGTIEYFTVGVAPNRQLIVNFINVPTFYGYDLITVQLVLNEGTNIIQEHVVSGASNFDGAIFFPGPDDPVTLGIENSTGTVASAPINQMGSVTVNPLTITYTPNITITNTSSPISYDWSPAVSNPTIYNPVGTPTAPTNYMVTITNGACVFTDSIQVDITGSLPAPTVSCGVSTFSTIPFSWTALALPGGGFYEYSTDGGATWTAVGTSLTATLTGLAPGTTETILVRGNDGLGTPCSPGAPGTVTCTTLSCILTSSDSITNVTCFGDATGAVDLTPIDGAPNYVYAWSHGATTEDLVGLTAGTYIVTITDVETCTTTDTMVVSQPAKGLGLVFDLTNPLCNTGTDGCAVVNVSFGTGNYSYNWGGIGFSTDTICGLGAGTYTVTVTDTVSAGSGGGGNLVLYDEAFDGVHGWTLNVSSGVNGTDPNFWKTSAEEGGFTAGQCGAVGTTNRTLHITSVFNPTGGAAYDAGGLCGILFCPQTATRAESPTISTIGQTGITLSFNYIAGGDALIDNASVVYSIDGGVSWLVLDPSIKSTTCPPFGQGLWTAFSATLPATCDNIPNLKVGFNWINNDDGLGTDPSVAIDSVVVSTMNSGSPSLVCVAVDTIILTEPLALAITVDSTNATNCNGDSTGAAFISVAGGSGAYNYNWSTGASTASAAGLAANVYTVSVTDTNSCIITENITITEPSVLVSAVDSTLSPTCNGTADGGIYIQASGGTAGYTYLWSNAETTQNLTAIASGSYSVTVMDANGCFTTIDTSINQPGAVSVAVDLSNDITCNGANDGTATVSGTSGTPSYTFLWSNGMTDASISGLAANTYVVTITDQNSCTDTVSVLITEPAALTATDSAANVNCFGDATGQGFVTAGGGAGAYTYNWPGGETTQSVLTLTAGTYPVTVTDASSCETTVTINITEPTSALVSTISTFSNLLCNGDTDGTATVSASGGTAGYTFVWDAAAGSQTTTQATGLAAGVYTATSTDNLGCTDMVSVTITEPTALTGSSSSTAVTCDGNGVDNGTVTATGAGGTGAYTYLWDAAAGSQNTATATGLAASPYVVTITDANNCMITVSDVVAPLVPLDSATVPLATSTTTLGCDSASNGILTVVPASGTGYTYLWSNGGTDASAVGLTNGTYTVTVTNSANCTMTQTGTVIAPFVPTVNPFFNGNPGEVTATEASATAVDIAGGTTDETSMGVSYQWTTSPSGAMFADSSMFITTVESMTGGTYTLLITATATSGCQDTGSIILNIESPYVGIPNAFTPNDDNTNDTFKPVGLSAEEILTFKVFNRWGQMVYDGSESLTPGWDGKYLETPQPTEAYIYLVIYQLNGTTEQVTLRGEVTLLR